MRVSIVILLVALTLTGCTTTPAPEVADTPTPSPTPAVRILTVEEAAPVYLAAICKSNGASMALTEAFYTYDLGTIAAAAAAAREANRDAATLLNEREGRWPAHVQEDVDAVMGQLLGEAGWYESIAKANSVEEVWAIVYPDELTSRESAQRIRLEFDLPSDTAAGCGEIGKLIF